MNAGDRIQLTVHRATTDYGPVPAFVVAITTPHELMALEHCRLPWRAPTRPNSLAAAGLGDVDLIAHLIYPAPLHLGNAALYAIHRANTDSWIDHHGLPLTIAPYTAPDHETASI